MTRSSLLDPLARLLGRARWVLSQPIPVVFA
jgi:hypothetical protein